MKNDLISLAEVASALADVSGSILRKYFRAPLTIDLKGDESPVTIADRSAEAAITQRIEKIFPEHGIIGEEFGAVREDASHVWVLDPIDGTQSFITGMPIFGTLIALVVEGIPKIGVIDQPIIGERWLGICGMGSTFNGNTVATKTFSALSESSMYSTHPSMFDGTTDEVKFSRLSSAVRQARFGGDCYAYGLLASGFVDLVVEAKMKPYDYMALVPVIEGAGGTVCDWTGKPLGIASDGHVLAAANIETRDEALQYLNP